MKNLKTKLFLSVSAMILSACFSASANASSQLGDVIVNYNSANPTSSTVTLPGFPVDSPYRTLTEGQTIPAAVIDAAYPSRKTTTPYSGFQNHVGFNYVVRMLGKNEVENTEQSGICRIRTLAGTTFPASENQIVFLDESIGTLSYFGGVWCSYITTSGLFWNSNILVWETTGNLLKTKINNNNGFTVSGDWTALDSLSISKNTDLRNVFVAFNSVLRHKRWYGDDTQYHYLSPSVYGSVAESIGATSGIYFENSKISIKPTSGWAGVGTVTGASSAISLSGSVFDGGGWLAWFSPVFWTITRSYVANSPSVSIGSAVGSFVFNNGSVTVRAGTTTNSVFFKNNSVSIHAGTNGNWNVVRSIFDTPGNLGTNFTIGTTIQTPWYGAKWTLQPVSVLVPSSPSSNFESGVDKMVTATVTAPANWEVLVISETAFVNGLSFINVTQYPRCQESYGQLPAWTACPENTVQLPFQSAGLQIIP